MEKLRNTILDNNLIERNDRIIVGLSGGPDSVCLFHGLYQLMDQMKFSMTAVHVNHKFRPGAAEVDQGYVEKLCKEMGTECRVFTYDCPNLAKEQGISGEEAGRNARYEAFNKAAAEFLRENPRGHVKIAVAHNMNDQAETLLFRLIRGTGTDGLAGMEYLRQGNGGASIIRPLLDIDRRDIEEYCKENKLYPCVDMTNFETLYTRNKVRLEMIPFIEKNFNSKLTEALSRLSRIAGEDKAYIWKQAEAEMEKIRGMRPGTFNCGKLTDLPPAIRHRIIMRALEEIGLNRDVSTAHIDAADRLIREARTSSGIDLPKGYRINISYGEAEFLPPKDLQDQDRWTIAGIGVSIISAGQWEAMDKTKKDRVAFDFEKLLLDYGISGEDWIKPVLRTRRDGDWLSLTGKGRKKLQNLFVDEKVPKEKRDYVLLVAYGSEILWALGDDNLKGRDTGLKCGRISGSRRISGSTESILLLEINT